MIILEEADVLVFSPTIDPQHSCERDETCDLQDSHPAIGKDGVLHLKVHFPLQMLVGGGGGVNDS